MIDDETDEAESEIWITAFIDFFLRLDWKLG